jgi:PKD repeat protein
MNTRRLGGARQYAGGGWPGAGSTSGTSRGRTLLGALLLAVPLWLLAACGSGSSQGAQTTQLTAETAAPVASFTYAPAAPAGGQAVVFTDTSSGSPTAWAWTFGDGTTSTVQHPSHTYAASGSFTVTLRATNAAGNGTATQTVVVATAVAQPSSGPTACTTTSDCAVAGACPADAAKGCACSATPQASRCVPQCSTSADCPRPPDQALVCSAGVCVPDGTGGTGAGGGTGTGGGSGGVAGGPTMNTDNTISDQAQSATIAFDGLAFVTGSFCAQTFYPPGKVADFFGFQYLRDNDPSSLGHNTEFTTLSADPVLAVLTDAQVSTFVTLAAQEQQLSDEYGLARLPLAKAFRRLVDGETPTGHAELSRDAVKAYSAYLFGIDGQMSFLRARAYAAVLGSMSASQRAVLDAMKGRGAAEWAQPASSPAALARNGQYSVQLRTYAGEMFAWYAGSQAADVYFCPERQGTYFGSFFMKDVKAMHNPSYTIDSNMTAEMGDAFLAALDSTQRALVTGLVTEQKQDLLAIVAKRDQISATLRSFLAQGGTVDEGAVVALARQYGELDGEISWLYATRFSAVGRSLTAPQRAALTALRKTATAEADGSADYDAQCGNGYLYSAPLQAPPAVMSTDFMFGVCRATGATCSADWDCCSSSCSSGVCATPFTFTSTAFEEGGTLPVAYTCDGAGGMSSQSPPLSWSGAPAGTVELALTMTTSALDGTKYNWVLFHVPVTSTSLAAGTTVGTAGVSTDGPQLRYYPPCSTGPGAKTYTFTLYALSAAPTFSVPESQVTGPILTSAIAPLILSSRELNVSYTRP